MFVCVILCCVEDRQFSMYSILRGDAVVVVVALRSMQSFDVAAVVVMVAQVLVVASLAVEAAVVVRSRQSCKLDLQLEI